MRKQYILYIVVILLSIINAINFNNASALSYSSEVGVGFTFNPTLSVSLSSSDLTIQGLPLGTTGTSNEVNVLVRSNAAYGYTLSATVGNNSTYNSDSLINNIDNNKVFSNIAVDADLSSLNDSASTNIWGYSYKDNTVDNPTWSSYNGLSLYSSTNPATLIDLNSNTSTDTSSLDFKIAAKASSTQPSGEYSNIINFVAVSKVGTISLLDAFVASNATMQNGYYTMQGMAPAICNAATIGSSLQLLDIRDNKLYWVTKLADNNCWMTQNLDLDLSHEVALTSETSDIDPDSYGTNAYTETEGYTKDENNVVYWTPNNTNENNHANTILAIWNGSSINMPNYQADNHEPYSVDPGNQYQYTNTHDFTETPYSSLSDCLNANNNDIEGCQHQHLGNYYNWPSIVASNNTSSLSANDKDASNSICPKGWRLPVHSSLDYKKLLTSQGVINDMGAYTSDGLNIIRIDPLYFVRSGHLYSSKLIIGRGSGGQYWTATYGNNVSVSALDFRPNAIYIDNENISRSESASARCLAR